MASRDVRTASRIACKLPPTCFVPAVHAYYALLCALGFLCPLSAASVTATHYLYGGSHQKSGVRLLAFRTNIQCALPLACSPSVTHSTACRPSHQHQNSLSKSSQRYFAEPTSVLRSFGSPFFSSTAYGTRYRSYEPATRPLNTTDVWNRDAISTDNSPILTADEGEKRSRSGTSTLRASTSRSVSLRFLSISVMVQDTHIQCAEPNA